MKNLFNKNAILFLLFFLLIAYLLLNTGIISDDFDVLNRIKGKSFKEVLIPRGTLYFIETPVEHFTHYIWYYFFRLDNSIADNIMKILYTFLSLYLIGKFFQIYMDRQIALLASFLFIFFPSHDSTVYLFMNQYLTLTFTFYLYSFYLAHKNRLFLACVFALLASFVSYGSPALAITLFFLFALNREFKKGMLLLIPNLLYTGYYFFISTGMGIGTNKIAEGIKLASIIKYLILQIVTFIDAMIGPSMWLKVYYSFGQLSLLSIIIGGVLTVIFYKKAQRERKIYNRKLLFGLTVLLLISFMMFSVTGLYPQLAFNIGNRTTIFGSLLIAYLFVSLPVEHKLRTLFFAVMIFSILGISDHWKNWNLQQKKVMRNIKNNQAIQNYHEEKKIYVSGNQYSKYGPISHIEFLSEDWVVGPLFILLLQRPISAKPINKRYEYASGYLIDRKYGTKEKLEDYVVIYDSEKDRLLRLDVAQINGYIHSLPADNRHWIQLYDNKLLKKIAVSLMPRLNYAF